MIECYDSISFPSSFSTSLALLQLRLRVYILCIDFPPKPRFASFAILTTTRNIPFHVANFVSSQSSLNYHEYELAQIVPSSKKHVNTPTIRLA